MIIYWWFFCRKILRREKAKTAKLKRLIESAVTLVKGYNERSQASMFSQVNSSFEPGRSFGKRQISAISTIAERPVSAKAKKKHRKEYSEVSKMKVGDSSKPVVEEHVYQATDNYSKKLNQNPVEYASLQLVAEQRASSKTDSPGSKSSKQKTRKMGSKKSMTSKKSNFIEEPAKAPNTHVDPERDFDYQLDKADYVEIEDVDDVNIPQKLPSFHKALSSMYVTDKKPQKVTVPPPKKKIKKVSKSGKGGKSGKKSH